MENQAILFADQVGSTKLLAEIGDEAMVAVHNRLWSMFTSSVADHRGEVLSDEGDGGSAVFASVAEAAMAALDMIDASNQPEDTASFDLRVAIHTGRVIRTTGAAVGMAVHLAARLCDEAPPGFVLTSDEAALGLADHADLRVTPFGRRSMKGIAQPHGVNLLTRSTDQAPSIDESDQRQPTRFRSSPLLDHVSTTDPFVGRAREVEFLEHALSRALSGTPEIVLLEGAPGAGKSTLTHRLGSIAIEAGAVCLIGRSDEALDDPFHEIIEMLQHTVADAPLPLLAEHVVRNGSLLTRLLPSLGDRVPTASVGDQDPAPDLRRLFDAVADLIRSMAREQPVVLVLEDLHWASPSSLDLFRFLLREALLGPVLLVSTYRGSELEHDGAPARFVSLVADEPNAALLSLGSFDLPVVTELCGDTLDVDNDVIVELGQALHHRTGGNPLFCAEMLRTLSTDPRLMSATANDIRSILDVPRSIQEVALRRVERLGADVTAVLTDAAVLGETFDFRTLRRLTEQGHLAEHTGSRERTPLAALDAAERVELIRADDAGGLRYTFGHALVQRALYDNMSTSARIGRHRAAADAHRDPTHGVTGGNAGEILNHLLNAGVLAEPSEIVEAASAAADAAAAKLALTEAIRLRRLVIDTLTAAGGAEPATLARAWLELGRAQTDALQTESRVSMANAAAAAEAASAWELHAAIAIEYGGSLKENQAPLHVAEPVALIQTSLRHHTVPGVTRSRLLMSLALWQRQHRPYSERRLLVDEAMATARSIDDPRQLAGLLADQHRALHGPNVAQEALATADELQSLATKLDDDVVSFQALYVRMIASLEVGLWEVAKTTGAEIEEVGHRLRNIEGRRIGLMWRVVQAQVAGDTASCRAAITELTELLEGYPDEELSRFVAIFIMPGVWLSGRLELMYQARSDRDPQHGWMAWFAAESGLLDEAAEHLRLAGSARDIEARSDYLWWLEAVALTRTAKVLGRVEMAAELYEIMLPYRSHNSMLGLAGFLGTAEHHLGTLSAVANRLDDAVDHFDRALDRYSSMGAVSFTALAQAELSNALDLRGGSGDADRASKLRTQASMVAESHKLALVANTLAQRKHKA